MLLYERLGCNEAASRFALAAIKQVRGGEGGGRRALWQACSGVSAARAARPPAGRPASPGAQVPRAMPQPQQLAERQQREGRLWANVFRYMLDAGRYEVGAAASCACTPACLRTCLGASGALGSWASCACCACAAGGLHRRAFQPGGGSAGGACAGWQSGNVRHSIPPIFFSKTLLRLLAQVDCVHELVNSLCAHGEVALLCRLPFADCPLVSLAGPAGSRLAARALGSCWAAARPDSLALRAAGAAWRQAHLGTAAG